MSQPRYLVRLPNWLGDAVMATPVLHDLKQHFPNCLITALAPPPILDLFKENPAVDEIIPFSRKKGEKGNESKRIQNLLRERQFDAGILLTGSFSSAWQFWRAGIPMRIGFPCHLRK